MKRKKRIDGHYYLKDDGSLVKFTGDRKDPFLTVTDMYCLTDGTEEMFPTLVALGKFKNRSGSWASLLYKSGDVKCIRVYSSELEMLPSEQFKPVIEGEFYLSNYGRMARLHTCKYSSKKLHLVAPHRTLAGYKQFPNDVVEKANLRTSQIAPNVLELFSCSRPSDDSICLYIDHNPDNTHVSNLKWGTRKEASANNGHHDRYSVPVKVVKGCRTKLLDPFIGQTFESISELARVSGTSPMNIRQYIQNGKVVILGKDGQDNE